MKKFLVLCLAICTITVPLRGMDNSTGNTLNRDKLQNIFIMGVVAGGLYGLNSMRNHPIVTRPHKAIGWNPKDTISLLGLGSLSYFLFDLTKNNIYKDWAVKAPVIGLSGILCSTKTAANLFEYVPLFGPYFACENQSCEGVCKSCNGRVAVKTAVCSFAAIQAIEAIQNKFFAKN